MPHTTTNFKPPFAHSPVISQDFCSVFALIFAVFIIAIALATPSIAHTMNEHRGYQETPEITVFVDPILKIIQASCCIDGIITYFEVYEDRDPAVGTCQLELNDESPEPDPGIVQLLEQAICAHCKKKGGALQANKQNQPSVNTPLIKTAQQNNCCQRCVVS